MYKEFQRQLNFSDYLVEGAHCRTGVYMTTDKGDVLNEKMKLGWSFESIEGGFVLRAPDISLVDITDPFRIYQLGDDINNFACFKLIKDLKDSGRFSNFINRTIFRNKDKYNKFEFFISEGPVLEGEIRIGGSDDRIKELKNDILIECVSNTLEWQRYKEDAKQFLGIRRKIQILQNQEKDFGKKTQDFILYINGLFKNIYPASKLLKMDTIAGLVDQLPNFDVMIFIPEGCSNYITSFMRDDVVDKIMLWEIHIEHPAKVLKLLKKDIDKKRCLIIDKSYTGKTLSRMASLVKEEGGVPIRLSVFPKSRYAIQNSEYSLLFDKIIDNATIDFNSKYWAEMYYKKILSGDYAANENLNR